MWPDSTRIPGPPGALHTTPTPRNSTPAIITSIYERYLWVKRSFMAVNMNAWDGNGYTGNLDLRPEVAHTLSATAGWQDAAKKGWALTVTPYLTRVQNYIDVERSR